MTIMPCGPPKPRNAVFEGRLVLAMRPWTSMSGIQYALSMWHSARASTGSDRSRLQPPLLVSVARSAHSRLSASKPASQVAKNGCRLPVICDVLVAVQPQAHRVPGERGPERRDGGQPVRLELLAAEAAAHAQALHGDLVRRQAEHVRHDVLGLGRVLRAGLDEDLPVLVDQRQRGLGLQVEVLLAADLELAAEPVRRRLQRGGRVAAADRPLVTLVAAGLDRVVHADQRGQRLVVGLDPGPPLAGPPPGSRPAPSRPRARST